MQPQEFRIGNFVKSITTYDEFNVVKEIGFSDNQRGYYLRLENVNHGVWLEHNDEDLILGIPLTEEWIVKFGLSKQNGYPYKFNNGYLKIRNGVFFFKYHNIEVEIQFVHQLQNLYFSLTGEELKIEPKTL